MMSQYRTAGFPGAAPQYGAMPQPQPQFAAAPQFVAPQPKFGAPQPQFAAAPQQFVPQPLSAGPPQQQFAQQFAAPATFKQPAVQGAIPPMMAPAPPPAASVAPRPSAPTGAEMLQVTVFGVQNIQGITSPTVQIEVAGKHNFQIETAVLNGECLNPKSTITYVNPGDGLIFSVTQGDQLFGQAAVESADFFPQGFEGDVVVGNNGETIAVKLAVLADGQIQQLAPVVVKATPAAPPVQSAPVIAGASAPRLCSPEEFQWACNQPGAEAPVTLTPDELAQITAPGFAQQQQLMQGGAPGAFQPQPFFR